MVSYLQLWDLCDFYGLQLLGDEIGKGAYGRVYKGLDLENGDFVAIKQVSLENIPSEDLASIMVGVIVFLIKSTDVFALQK